MRAAGQSMDSQGAPANPPVFRRRGDNCAAVISTPQDWQLLKSPDVLPEWRFEEWLPEEWVVRKIGQVSVPAIRKNMAEVRPVYQRDRGAESAQIMKERDAFAAKLDPRVLDHIHSLRRGPRPVPREPLEGRQPFEGRDPVRAQPEHLRHLQRLAGEILQAYGVPPWASGLWLHQEARHGDEALVGSLWVLPEWGGLPIGGEDQRGVRDGICTWEPAHPSPRLSDRLTWEAGGGAQEPSGEVEYFNAFSLRRAARILAPPTSDEQTRDPTFSVLSDPGGQFATALRVADLCAHLRSQEDALVAAHTAGEVARQALREALQAEDMRAAQAAFSALDDGSYAQTIHRHLTLLYFELGEELGWMSRAQAVARTVAVNRAEKTGRDEIIAMLEAAPGRKITELVSEKRAEAAELHPASRSPLQRWLMQGDLKSRENHVYKVRKAAKRGPV